MARRQFTGEGRVWYVPTIANTSAPTTSEVNAGTDLTPFLRRDGLTTPQDGNTIDIADASSRFNKTAPGTYGGDAIEIAMYRDSVSGSDTAYAALPRDTAGYIVIRRFGGSTTAIASSQKVEVWQGTVISRAMEPIGDNEPQRFTVRFSVEAVPVDTATIA